MAASIHKIQLNFTLDEVLDQDIYDTKNEYAESFAERANGALKHW